MPDHLKLVGADEPAKEPEPFYPVRWMSMEAEDNRAQIDMIEIAPGQLEITVREIDADGGVWNGPTIAVSALQIARLGQSLVDYMTRLVLLQEQRRPGSLEPRPTSPRRRRLKPV